MKVVNFCQTTVNLGSSSRANLVSAVKLTILAEDASESSKIYMVISNALIELYEELAATKIKNREEKI